jgi:cytochrome c peroxidase
MKIFRYFSLPSLVLFSFIILALSGCNGNKNASSEIDGALRVRIEELGLRGDPSIGRTLPSVEEPIVQLGMQLFYAKSLGGQFDSACVSCHHPTLGGGDALPLSIGVDAVDPDHLGPGRVFQGGDLPVPRNAPSTFNIALYDSNLFWDGRVESLGATSLLNGDDGLGLRTPDVSLGHPDPLAGHNLPTAQSRFPVTSVEEMRGEHFLAGASNEVLRNALAQRLSSLGWGPYFANVFGDARVSFDRIAAALGAFERSQVFVDTPWRSYVQGDSGAISEEAKRGALLFLQTEREGGFGCSLCHTGDFFTDEKFWALAVPQIGRGKGDGVTGSNDYGRARETGRREDRFAFRTPSLLNVEVTGPYTHSGVFGSLEEVVRHHLDPQESLTGYDPEKVPLAASIHFQENQQELLTHLHEHSLRVISTFQEPRSFEEEDVADLVAFLKTLTDPCVKDRSCLSPWIPDESLQDPDGMRLVFQ